MGKESEDDSGVIYLRLDLEGDMATNWRRLKKKMGLRSNTEMARLIIVREFDRAFGSS